MASARIWLLLLALLPSLLFPGGVAWCLCQNDIAAITPADEGCRCCPKPAPDAPVCCHEEEPVEQEPCCLVLLSAEEGDSSRMGAQPCDPPPPPAPSSAFEPVVSTVPRSLTPDAPKPGGRPPPLVPLRI